MTLRSRKNSRVSFYAPVVRSFTFHYADLSCCTVVSYRVNQFASSNLEQHAQVSRWFFTEVAAEEYPKVRLCFNKKLVDADLEKGTMTFLKWVNAFLISDGFFFAIHKPPFFTFSTKTGAVEDAEADLIIGADGAYSKMRKIMGKSPIFDCSQANVELGYVELSVPSGANNEVK